VVYILKQAANTGVIAIKISTKGRYGLEAVLYLAIQTPAGSESLKNIAQARDISENYLEQIFIKLKKKGIVESIRGAQGGYKLAREPKDITVGEVIRPLEGSLAPVACVKAGKDKKSCKRYEFCATRVLWNKLADELEYVADTVTIGDLAAMHAGRAALTALNAQAALTARNAGAPPIKQTDYMI